MRFRSRAVNELIAAWASGVEERDSDMESGGAFVLHTVIGHEGRCRKR